MICILSFLQVYEPSVAGLFKASRISRVATPAELSKLWRLTGDKSRTTSLHPLQAMNQYGELPLKPGPGILQTFLPGSCRRILNNANQSFERHLTQSRWCIFERHLAFH